MESPTSIRGSSMVPTASGPRLGTLASNACRADRPPGSVAVTATVAVPRETPRTVTPPPPTAAATMPGSADVAVKFSGSPSGSLKYPATFTVMESPNATCWSGIAPTGCGGWFGSTGGRVVPSPQADSASRAAARTRRPQAEAGTAGSRRIALNVFRGRGGDVCGGVATVGSLMLIIVCRLGTTTPGRLGVGE